MILCAYGYFFLFNKCRQITYSQNLLLDYHNRWVGWWEEDGGEEDCSPGGLVIDWPEDKDACSAWHQYAVVELEEIAGKEDNQSYEKAGRIVLP